MATTLNGWTILKYAPIAHFSAPNGCNNNVSAVNAAAAALASHFVEWWDKNLEKVTSCNGYRPNNNVNPDGPTNSNHLSATAWDINGAQHLYELYHEALYRSDVYRALGFSQRQLDAMRKFSNSIVGRDGRPVFRLGIDFDSPFRDPMHFEIAPWTTEEDLLFAAARIGAAVGSKASNPGGARIVLGDRGSEVKIWQRFLNTRDIHPKLKVDSVFGPKMKHAVEQWQKNNHLEVDGIIGKASKAKRNAQIKAEKAAKARVKKHLHLDVDGSLGTKTIRRWQDVMGTPEDGEIDKRSALIKAVQTFLKHKGYDLKADGVLGPITIKALQRYFGTPVDGKISADSPMVRKLQASLNKQSSGSKKF